MADNWTHNFSSLSQVKSLRTLAYGDCGVGWGGEGEGEGYWSNNSDKLPEQLFISQQISKIVSAAYDP